MRSSDKYLRTFITFIIFVCVLALTAPASALIMQVDDPFFGTDAIIRDVDNNRDFLRLDFTTPYTYNQVLSETAVGGVFESWSIASLADMNLLGSSADVVHGSTDAAMLARAEELRDWFCFDCVLLSSTHEYARGLISDTSIVDIGDGPVLVQDAFSIGRRFNVTPEEVDYRVSGWSYQDDKIHPVEGIFLVRDAVVPEPSTMFLIGTGLVGLAGFRK